MNTCSQCDHLSYHTRRLPCLRERHIEFLRCRQRCRVTVADLKQSFPCKSFIPRNPDKEVPQDHPERQPDQRQHAAPTTYSEKETKMSPLYIPVSTTKPIADTTHPARCTMIAELGTQVSEMFDSSSRQIVFTWALLDEPRESEGGTYHARVSRTYTETLNAKSNLRKLLDGWVGHMSDAEVAKYDVFDLAGAPAWVRTSIQESNGKATARIESVIGVPAGVSVPEATVAPITYKFGEPIPAELPEWLVKKIKASPDYTGF